LTLIEKECRKLKKKKAKEAAGYLENNISHGHFVRREYVLGLFNENNKCYLENNIWKE
jgi:hypothetical protein